jgi:hypothetical protein
VFCTDADDEDGGWVEALLPYSNFVIQVRRQTHFV